ncbi:MAG TPA: alpha/beta fold hydrolase [Candidatus Obscuribacterales bacterium]
MAKPKLYPFLAQTYPQVKPLYNLLRYRYHQLDLLKPSSFKQLQSIHYQPSKTVAFLADGLQLKGDLYLPENSATAPTIILLHGSSVLGRKLPIIPALAEGFKNLGYRVFAFDLRAHGESEQPQNYTTKSFNFAQDVTAAIDYLSTNFPSQNNQIYVLGHSFGAGVTMAAQAQDSRISKAVVFSPPRRLRERFLSPEAQEKEKLMFRWQIDMQLPKPLEFGFWEPVMVALDIETYLEDFTQPGHIPLLIIDAELEPPEDLVFLRDLSQKMVPPVEYWTIPQANHYLNTGLILNKGFAQGTAISTFVNYVNNWLKIND